MQDNQYNNQATETAAPMTLSEKLSALRQEWTNTVQDLNSDMGTLHALDKLLNVVYMKRQDAVSVHSNIISVYDKQVRNYRVKFAELYNSFKLGTNGIRYTNESSIQLQCEAALIDHKEIVDDLKNFIDFMWETVKTIDGIIYGINYKMKVYEIQNGIKF